MKKLAAFISLLVAIVLFWVAIGDYSANRKERWEILDSATKDMQFEQKVGITGTELQNAHLDEQIAQLEGKKVKKGAVSLAEARYGAARSMLGERSAKEEFQQVDDLDNQSIVFLWMGAAGAAFLIVSLLLFIRRSKPQAQPILT